MKFKVTPGDMIGHMDERGRSRQHRPTSSLGKCCIIRRWTGDFWVAL